jgi:hypothetical protein
MLKRYINKSKNPRFLLRNKNGTYVVCHDLDILFLPDSTQTDSGVGLVLTNANQENWTSVKVFEFTQHTFLPPIKLFCTPVGLHHVE